MDPGSQQIRPLPFSKPATEAQNRPAPELVKILKNKSLGRGFNPEEAAQAKRTVLGTMTGNAARKIGKALAPTGALSLAPASGVAGLTYMSGGDPSTAAGAGAVARIRIRQMLPIQDIHILTLGVTLPTLERVALIVVVLVVATLIFLPGDWRELFVAVLLFGWMGVSFTYFVVKSLYFEKIEPKESTFVRTMRVAVPAAALIAAALSAVILVKPAFMLPLGKELGNVFAILFLAWLGGATTYYGMLVVYKDKSIPWLPFVMILPLSVWAVYRFFVELLS